jgi:hypothetical protein
MKHWATAFLGSMLLLASSAQAQGEMSVAGFLVRADRAQSLGKIASLTSPDYLILRGEVTFRQLSPQAGCRLPACRRVLT